jgi:phage gp29-like protein
VLVVALMGWLDRLFRREPPRAVVADVKALAARSEAHPEIYAPIEQPGSTVWRLYPEEDITPERWRNYQKDADLGFTHQLMELYDAVANDYHVASQLRTRKLSVAGAPVRFEPGGVSRRRVKNKAGVNPAAQRIADDAELFWKRIPNRSQMVVDMMDDFFRGFSCVRPIWDSIGGRWWVVAHQAVESRYFRFVNATDPIICAIPGGTDGIPVPDGYLYSEFRDKAGPVVRAGIGRSITRSWIYKGYGLVDTASFIERFGTPHVQVKTDRILQPGDPVLQQCKDAARAIITDQIGVLPSGATLEFVQAINTASTTKDVFLAYIDFHDMAISKAIVGQVLTADAGPGGIGHGGAAKEQGDVRQDLKEADAERMSQVLTDRLIRPWTLYHYGPNAPVPYLCFDVAKPEDKVQATLAQKQRAETINILRSSGLRIQAAQQYADFDLEEPSADDEVLIAAPQPTNDTGDPSKGVPTPGTAPAPNS